MLVRGLCGDRAGSGPVIGLAGPEEIGPIAIGLTGVGAAGEDVDAGAF